MPPRSPASPECSATRFPEMRESEAGQRGSLMLLAAGPRRVALWLTAGLAVLYAGWLTYVIRADRPLDFYVYYLAAETFARGGNAYSVPDSVWDGTAAELGISNYTRPYRYPPHLAALLTLTRPLGPRRTMIVWVIASAAAMIGGGWLLGLSLGGGWWLPASLASLLLFVAPLATLLTGQVNGFVFFCLALAFWGLTARRTGSLAIGLAVGAALKVTPMALVLYLFWRRQWRAGLIALIVLLGLTLACVPAVGWDSMLAYGRDAIFLSKPDTNILFDAPTNQTITGTLVRLLPGLPTEAMAVGGWLSLLLALITIVLCYPRRGSAQLMPLEFGLVQVTLHLIPPFSWYHQLVLLLVPLLIVTRQLWNQRLWVWLGVLAGLYTLADLHGIAWHALQGWPWLTISPFLLEVTLWATLAWLIARRRTASVQPLSGFPHQRPDGFR